MKYALYFRLEVEADDAQQALFCVRGQVVAFLPPAFAVVPVLVRYRNSNQEIEYALVEEDDEYRAAIVRLLDRIADGLEEANRLEGRRP